MSATPSPQPVTEHVIIAGIDGGTGSPQVLRSAARLAELGGGSVVVAHVVATAQLASNAYAVLSDSALAEIEADLFPDVVEALLGCDVSWTLVTLTGNVAMELIRLSDEYSATAIVVGADTPGWTSQLRRLSTGSVPSRLAHEQRAPVVIIPDGCSRSRDRAADRSAGHAG